jgi:hypothetical protein
MEIWKDISEKPNYQISNKGRVKSKHRVITRSNGAKQTVKERIIKTYFDSNGYERAVLQHGKKTKQFAVHRLVAMAFIENKEGKPFVNHIDGNKTNNTLSNLEWVTKSENERHAFMIGLKCLKGENHNQSKLTEAQVREIRSKKGVNTYEALAKEYGVTKSAISSILNNRTWNHL